MHTPDRWKDYETQAAKGPKDARNVALKAFFIILGLVLVMAISLYAISWFGEAATVLKREAGPNAALAKYSWFKDAAAGLDKKQADIQVYSTRLGIFENMDRKEMDRTDKTQQAQWMSEVAGVKASYNSLAADWNSQISKFHWEPFLGDLPPGADILLTKEYAPYEIH